MERSASGQPGNDRCRRRTAEPHHANATTPWRRRYRDDRVVGGEHGGYNVRDLRPEGRSCLTISIALVADSNR
jgi:hypothetical protein